MKKYAVLFFSLFIFFGCSKEQEEPTPTPDAVITETFIYQGKEYVLTFLDGSDDPENQEVADELISLLEGKEFYLVGKASDPIN